MVRFVVQSNRFGVIGGRIAPINRQQVRPVSLIIKSVTFLKQDFGFSRATVSV